MLLIIPRVYTNTDHQTDPMKAPGVIDPSKGTNTNTTRWARSSILRHLPRSDSDFQQNKRKLSQFTFREKLSCKEIPSAGELLEAGVSVADSDSGTLGYPARQSSRARRGLLPCRPHHLPQNPLLSPPVNPARVTVACSSGTPA